MNVISLLLVIAVVGLIAWLITTYIPMPPKFATLIYVIAGIAVVVYLLQALGVVGGPALRLK